MRSLWVLLAVGCGSPATEPPGADAAPEVVVEQVATGLDEPTALAVDGTHVYFVHRGGNLSRVAKSGGGSSPIASAQRGPGSLDASTDRLCWVNTGTHSLDFLDGSVRCAPKAGGSDVELASSYFPASLAIDGGVYWVEIDGQQVRTIGLDGSNARTLDTSPTSKTNIAITPAYLAWTASGDMADVVRMDRASGALTVLSTADYAPGAVVIDGDIVYWVTRHALSDDGALRMWKDGSATDLVPDEYYPTGLVRAGSALYWTSDGRIRGYDGAVHTVIGERGTIGGLVTDGEDLYWSEPDRGAILRIRRGTGSDSRSAR